MNRGLEFSVSDFVAIFNQTISALYTNICIYGEITNLRISRGKWVYFDLKDEQSSLKFFGSVYKMPGPLEDGMTVKVFGSPYLHPEYNFSVQFSSVSVVGEGSISRAHQILFEKLQKEGLFSVDRKRLLADVPEKISLIASKESAGYGDFMKNVKNRWPILKIKEYDVLVQGVDAPHQISNAINKASQTDSDVIVILRGGGSRDDLTAFDDERVVRAVASSRTPTLVAVGHERDVVLAELAADMRASTPSNAAEILVPDIVDEQKYLKIISEQVESYLKSYVSRIDQLIQDSKTSLFQSISFKISSSIDYINFSKDLLVAYDPLTPLKKGYAYVEGPDGVIKTAKEAKNIQSFGLRFIDGKINVRLEE